MDSLLGDVESPIDQLPEKLEAEVSINYQNEYGQTILMVASRHGNHQVAEMLLNNGANINQADNSGNTALLMAIESGCHEIVTMLLNKEVNINHADLCGCTALMAAAVTGIVI
ncbi:MAG: ankyrin repeat domain-containing protein [Alphaproteobacteria bacterium]|nr:ankyrin repeat domain-containing protein [Alphaproteobacteria bacterium]